jgi:hypothetical protein
MQKDRAARALAPRGQIIVENDDEIVETVVAPKCFVARLGWQANKPVIIAGVGVVTPAKLAANGMNWQPDARPTAD